MRCNLDYKSVYAFAFLFDFCRDKSDEKGKRPGYVVIRDKREIQKTLCRRKQAELGCEKQN